MAALTSRRRRSPRQTIAGSHQRLAGVDLARGAALLAMMSTHLLPTLAADPTLGGQITPTWVGLVLSGRAAALFAVLAGVSLSLGRVPAAANRPGLALRAGAIAVVGLSLGALQVNIAVILVQYAVLFWCVIPALGLGQKALGLLTAAWLLIAPLATFEVRPWLLDAPEPLRLGHSPAWTDLMEPPKLLADVFVTGAYPVLEWFGYILAGLWIGRLPLRRAGTAVALLVGGAATALLAKGAEWALMTQLGGHAALLATPQAKQWPLDAMLTANLTGVDQTGSVWWLATAAPHSGTTLDLLHTCGTSAAALGAFLLVARIRPLEKTRILLPLAGTGAMTLTLYTAHVCAVAWSEAGNPPQLSREGLLAVHIVAALAVGLLFRANGWRGPLEWATHGAYRLGLIGQRSRPPGRGGGIGRGGVKRAEAGHPR
ncbi:heparan-alpha-glucosaminide N-acetyltransferase domain-containing protein [Sinomonas sp. JGH33]|uniref:Heparan-alpha-glucosaminide N-acetyltransferase domain-containing protein n=1 Tax=Sinomonas terricola TaxID=3110330 RepID=A0ABU5T4G9_9MICC|nr:heparan-alpha-glucosaminide N-acetyltransferase domain-containing protein [Sinomonas sp. JGH33]MEA5454558.1 heparan-alpha-glucosaminide N-acetyltransferase domain-containing protein [Sinomonas sp. JGH33]